jgi:hypothetical protein
MKSYIYNDLTGYRILNGADDSDVWAEIMTNDNLLISLDPIAYDKTELRNWLLSRGYNSIKPTLYDNLYQITPTIKE